MSPSCCHCIMQINKYLKISRTLISLVFLRMSIVEEGCHLSSLVAAPPFSLFFCCQGFVFFYFVFVIHFVGAFMYPLHGYFVLPLWVFWFFLMSIFILMVLRMTEIFRSILNRDVIHSSNCSTFLVSLLCEICLDIDSLQATSRAIDRLLVQNVKYIYFLLNFDLIYLFQFLIFIRLIYE